MSLALSVDHLGLSVTAEDLEPTIDWYTDKLDFIVERRFEVHGTQFVFIVRDGFRIELVGAASARQAAVTDVRLSHNVERLHHVCLAVNDLDQTLAELLRRGVRPINEPMKAPAIGQRFAFITDNCGSIIELTQPGHRPAGGQS